MIDKINTLSDNKRTTWIMQARNGGRSSVAPSAAHGSQSSCWSSVSDLGVKPDLSGLRDIVFRTNNGVLSSHILWHHSPLATVHKQDQNLRVRASRSGTRPPDGHCSRLAQHGINIHGLQTGEKTGLLGLAVRIRRHCAARLACWDLLQRTTALPL
ncbi:hypothetical protein ASPWEDRAFT_39381 [Aspergillus wentii DTO 134E9]|uniref:Uncharacterized protein n=1 Tax=Aspergillus wentii DTO 134E9 TaxID=1073089 RepID=A0A1L9RRR9_ASPWE|nr:uncharacterized protein ASPWEDRAFT_39381 [Aspergillus wentii DTO 134E9]OJJ37650.1 hypothetical protein ASPWEDRAFT_39381 [Aspergillus wentii DTO 134E9]